MKMTKWAGLELSQLMLGTCQLGLDYGIANKGGQPSYETARDILARAYEGGVNCLDTGAGYGTSEELLGKALTELGIADKVVVATKIVALAQEYSSAQAADEIVAESVTRSLQRLRLEVLPICMIHGEKVFHHVESLLKLKDKGLVQHVGCSVMTPETTLAIISSGLAEVVQLPTNLLDHRFIRAGVFAEAKKRGVAVFIRSIYLQGLILLPEDEILPELVRVIPARRRLERLANEAGMSMTELAVRYVLGIEGMTCALVGVESVEQMAENLKLVAKGPLEPTLMKMVADIIPDLPDKMLKPNLWSKRIPDAVPEMR